MTSFDAGLALGSKPIAPGIVEQSYVWVEDAARQVAEQMRGLAEPTGAAIRQQVEAELSAVEQTELGVLTGRASQAVTLSPLAAAPSQVAAAQDLFRNGDRSKLRKQVQATAACTAAVGFLEQRFSIAATQVFYMADSLQVTDLQFGPAILDDLADGLHPEDVVATLIRSAKDERPSRGVRLDPARPARDLLEQLLDAINACTLVYFEEVEYRTADGSMEASFDNDDDEFTVELFRRLDADFWAAVVEVHDSPRYPARRSHRVAGPVTCSPIRFL